MWMGPPRRRYGGWGMPYGYRRPRTQVRVGGCCLPIPLGLMTAGALGLRLAMGRRRPR
jgi:hypothetical protein